MSYIWLGVRESDIEDTGSLFDGSITMFGSGQGSNCAMDKAQHRRIDHNGSCPSYEEFFQGAMARVLAEQPDARFFQYAALDGIGFAPEYQERFCFQNDYALLSFLEHKRQLKKWAEEYVPVLPGCTLRGGALSREALRDLFPGAEAVVVQRNSSCGGMGTFLVHLDAQEELTLPIEAEEPCMAVPFQSNSISVNVHAVLYEEQTLLFPPSIQIIDQGRACLEYQGGDFSAYGMLPAEEREQVLKTAQAVGDALRRLGYRGVCGIDLLVSDGICWFMEVNPRFQASTALLNRSLRQDGCPSLQEYHIDAFSHSAPTLPLPPSAASGSFFTYHYSQDQRGRLEWLWRTLRRSENFSLRDDGLCWEDRLDDNCYVFQLRRAGAISCVTYQHTLRLHPNVQLSPFVLDQSGSFFNLIRLKILLLCRGISVSPEAWQTARQAGGMDWEEFGAITVLLLGKYWITAPCMEPWHDLSPVELSVSQDGGFVLRWYGQLLFPVEVMPEDPTGQLQTQNGHFLKDIVYLNPDRLRVYHRNGCALQSAGMGCKFCDLYGAETDFTFDEICEALSYYWNNPRVNHFLIGGGSGPQESASILALADYIHAHSGKHIYVMAQPIGDQAVLARLRDCGVTEIAFNIEMFDRELAVRTMPGKAQHTEQDYFRYLEQAAEVWGRTGNVRSAVLLGFDDLDGFTQGIRVLCGMGVAPILSVFRPCPDTPLADYMPPDELFVLACFESAERACQDAGLKLGPSCQACQNNVVALEL